MFKYVLVASALAALAAVGSAQEALLGACNNADYKGNCRGWAGNLKTCHGFTNEWNDVISSIWVQHDKGYVCKIYRDAGCKGDGPQFDANTPIRNLQDHYFNDMASSYYCWLS
ncbi:hypothetical protein BGZ97_001622 [Linnemannia gamsii]|jgi:hypothetical protein|uniref:Uncharacterized protein n=1 Tax=Linnemannia gamsii TaxID=64522 RepID=A0A9P6QY38_9FUNG|nr:hypothetical protein BGZ97_001622 [Linnemannia gamsii]